MIINKYIRTKYGIYKVAEINGMIIARGGVAFSCNIADVHFPIVFKEQDIIAQADNLEELCDEFVGVDEKDERYTFAKSINGLIHMVYDNLHVISIIIYGAIWTDKGLIYVAKMNEKGELELL